MGGVNNIIAAVPYGAAAICVEVREGRRRRMTGERLWHLTLPPLPRCRDKLIFTPGTRQAPPFGFLFFE